MGTLKKRHITVLICVFAVCIGIAACWKWTTDQRGSNAGIPDTETSQTTLFSYYINPKTPPNIARELQKYLENAGFELQNGPEGATVAISPTEPSNDTFVCFYQIWALARPYGALLAPVSTNITQISDRIDALAPMDILPEGYTVSENARFVPWADFADGTSDTANDSDIDALTLLTLQDIQSSYTVQSIEGIDPFAKDTWLQPTYPLISTVYVTGPTSTIYKLSDYLDTSGFFEENGYLTALPSPDDMLTIIKTGTTVSGGPGWELCEQVHGSIDYPIFEVENILSSADLTIISNEASFVEGCAQGAGTTAFCGKPSYIQNLIDIGTDIVSLTGNHMCDYGKTAFSDMLTTYDQHGISYFASGRNTTEAWTPLVVNTDAGKIAFIGVNFMGSAGVLATESTTGTAFYESEAFRDAISSAKETTDIVWVDTQLWPEYGTSPGADQISISREAIDAGADIVTGVSSHEMQGMTIYNGKPVFYGLGNFLFDQMWSTATRQGLILELTVYDGTIRQITPMPTVLYDYCQPRFAQGNERTTLLDYFLSISSL